jgi:pre-mRNA-processing factor 6
MSFQTPLDAKKYGPPPSHYVPGFGRGAVGFTTRSDIGPPRLTPDPPCFGLPPSGYIPGFGRGAQSISKEEGGIPGVAASSGTREEEDYSESKYDEWAGYGGSLFAYGDYDEEDREADEIYGSIDRHMDGRRRRRREERLRDELEKMR